MTHSAMGAGKTTVLPPSVLKGVPNGTSGAATTCATPGDIFDPGFAKHSKQWPALDYPGAKITISGYSDGLDFECPLTCDGAADPADARVIDAGHAPIPGGVRSELDIEQVLVAEAAQPDSTAIHKAMRQKVYYDPANRVGDVKAEVRPATDNQAAVERERAARKHSIGNATEVMWEEFEKDDKSRAWRKVKVTTRPTNAHSEGDETQAAALLTKMLVDHCLLEGRVSPMHVSHFPGELNWGDYEKPGWALSGMPAALKPQYGSGEFPISANVENEMLRKPKDTSKVKYEYNSDYGAPWNSRVAFVNSLLGAPKPFVTRPFLPEEIQEITAKAKGDPDELKRLRKEFYDQYGIYDPADDDFRRRGSVQSIHADTSSATANLGDDLSKVWGPKLMTSQRPRAADGVLAQDSADLLTRTHLRADQMAKGGMAGDYARLLEAGKKQGERVKPDATGNLIISAAVLAPAERRMLGEDYQMTSDDPEFAKEVASGKYRIQVQVEAKKDGVLTGKSETHSLKIGNKIIEKAQDKLAMYANMLCPGRKSKKK